MISMRSVVATRRQFLLAAGVALAGAAVSRSIGAETIKDVSAGFRSSPSAGGPGGISAAPRATATPTAAATPTATPTATPAPTPATVTIPVPVSQQSMVLDCETAALQQGLAYYGLNVSQSELFAEEYADVPLPGMGANHTVLRWGNPYTNFVGYVNGSDWTPTGYRVYWPAILRLAPNPRRPHAIRGAGAPAPPAYHDPAAGRPVPSSTHTPVCLVR